MSTAGRAHVWHLGASEHLLCALGQSHTQADEVDDTCSKEQPQWVHIVATALQAWWV